MSSDLSARLAALANPGGWPYYAGRASRIEATCWGLMAASAAGGASRSDLERHLAFLREAQQGGGLLVEPGYPVPNLGWNGLALLALQSLDADTDQLADRLTAAIVASRGVALEPDPLIGQDNRLQAWSWIIGTFSWIEPTAMCLLALKRAGDRRPEAATARIAEAERVLIDRVCPTGGWNYGNASVLGQDLRPYVPTTALALLALQDRAAEPGVRMSLQWLEAHARSEASSMALSLAAIGLSVYRRPYAPVLEALAAQEARTGFLDNAHLIAMAWYASALPSHDAAAFRLPRPGRARGGAA